MPFTDSYANQILNFAFSKVVELPSPRSVYIGLCSNDPEADGGKINELSDGGYARVLISRREDEYPDVIGTAAYRSISNQKQINWPKATLDWPEAKGFFLATTEGVGEILTIFFYGKLEEPVTCHAGDVALFDPYTLKISFPVADATA